MVQIYPEGHAKHVVLLAKHTWGPCPATRQAIIKNREGIVAMREQGRIARCFAPSRAEESGMVALWSAPATMIPTTDARVEVSTHMVRGCLHLYKVLRVL